MSLLKDFSRVFFFPPVVYSWLLCRVDDTRNGVGEKKSRCLPWLLCLLSCGERRRYFKVLIFRVSIKFFCCAPHWGEILSSSVSSHVYNFINILSKKISLRCQPSSCVTDDDNDDYDVPAESSQRVAKRWRIMKFMLCWKLKLLHFFFWMWNLDRSSSSKSISRLSTKMPLQTHLYVHRSGKVEQKINSK